MISPNKILLLTCTFIIVACSQEPKTSDNAKTKKTTDSPISVTESSEKTVITIDEDKAKKLKEERAKQQGDSAFSDNNADSNDKKQNARQSKDSPMKITTEDGKTVITIDKEKAKKIREERVKRQQEVGKKSAFE